MNHKFRGQEVRADLLHNAGQRIASACGGNGPCNFSLAQEAFPKEAPTLDRRPQETKKSVIVGSSFQWLIALLAKMCFFWLLASQILSPLLVIAFPVSSFFFFNSDTFQVSPSVEKHLITKSLRHSPPFCNKPFFWPSNPCPWMVFAELEIISAALYSDDPVVQNPRHMEGACAHFFAIHPSCSDLL